MGSRARIQASPEPKTVNQNSSAGVLFTRTEMDALEASFPGRAVSPDAALEQEFERDRKSVV